MTITQTYQFGKLGRKATQYNGKTFDRLIDHSKVYAGRPTLKRLIKAKLDGFTIVWLYSKVRGKPELVDSINLGR